MMLTTLLIAAAVLTSVDDLREAEARQAFGSTFDVEATLVSLGAEDRETFSIQDGNVGMTCWNHAGDDFAKAVPGDRVRIRGRMNPSCVHRNPAGDSPGSVRLAASSAALAEGSGAGGW